MPEQSSAAGRPDDPVSLARAALAAARAAARGAASGAAPRRAGSGAGTGAGTASGGGTAPGSAQRTGADARRPVRARSAPARPGFAAQPQRDDPQLLAAAIGGLLEAEGWTLAAATGSVFSRWAEIVGTDLAEHTTPEKLTDGELTVAADSTAWATQLRLLAGQLVKRLNAELGDGTVLRVRVIGPVTTARQPGQWRVRGSRGPRDTYG